MGTLISVKSFVTDDAVFCTNNRTIPSAETLDVAFTVIDAILQPNQPEPEAPAVSKVP